MLMGLTRDMPPWTIKTFLNIEKIVRKLPFESLWLNSTQRLEYEF